MNTFWVAFLIIIAVGHVIWFFIYTIRILKNEDAVDQTENDKSK